MALAWPADVVAGVLLVQWEAPTTNTDGSALDDLWGYRVYVGQSGSPCPSSFDSVEVVLSPVSTPTPGTLVSATLPGLTAGAAYRVQVTAFDPYGNESPCTEPVAGVARQILSVGPTALSFGDVKLGTSALLGLTVTNTSASPVTGTVTAAAPFSIAAGGSLKLAPGASQTVNVRFAPTTARSFLSSVNIVGDGDSLSRAVTGTGVTTTPALLRFSKADYTVTEGGTATITVSRTGGTHGDVTVRYAAGGGSAMAGADYTAAAGTLTFAAGQMSRTFTVATRPDTVAQGLRSVTLTLSAADGGAVLTTPSASTLTIVDDEPSLRFSAASYTVAETAVRATITVIRIGSPANVLTVDYETTPGTGSPGPGGDYLPVAGTLTFLAGQMSRTFTVPILDDDVQDGPKTVGVRLTNPTLAWLAMPNTAVITITDSDVAGTVQFAAAQYLTEAGAGTLNVTVTRTGGTAAGASVAYAVTGGTAAPGLDFSGGGTGTVTFGRGATTATIPLALVKHDVRRGLKTVELALQDPGGGATLGALRRTRVTIEEVAFDFAPSIYKVSEGGVATITVVRTGPTRRPATIEWTTHDGTATAGVDYIAATGTLTFPVGVRTRTLAVATLPDAEMEHPETVLLALRNPSAGALLGAQSTAILTIVDNDGGETVGFSAAAYTVVEGAGSAIVTIRRVGPTTTPVSVVLTTRDGTARAGVDYTAVSTSVDFPPGVTTRSVTIPIVANANVDGPRTLELLLSGSTPPAALGTASTAVLTILDDDAALEFEAADYRIAEGATAIITVRRVGSALGTVSVGYTVTSGTAAAGSDFAGSPGRLTFGPGVMRKTFSVRTLADVAVEGDETVRLALEAPAGNATIGPRTTATLTIADNPPTVSFAATGYTASEGASRAVISVRRTGPSTGTVTVDYRRSGGTAPPADYALSAGQLTFPPGVMSRTFTVGIADDQVAQGSRTVVVELLNAVGAVVGTPGTTTVTLQDNEPQVRFATATYTVKEGTPAATLTVVRTGSASVPVTVGYAAVGGTATGGGLDYTLTPGTLTFAPGVTSRTIAVGIANDGIPEAPETMVIGLTAATNATIGAPGTATLTILDSSPQVRFAAATYAVTEGTPMLTIPVLRSGPTAGMVTVDYTVLARSSATSGQDYTLGGNGRLTFNPGVTMQTVTVTIVNDQLVEPVETIDLSLGSPVNATLGMPAVTTVSVKSNDMAGIVRFADALFSADVTKGEAIVTITRQLGLAGAISIDVATVDGSAVAGIHYTAVAGTLTFGPNETAVSFAVPLLDGGGGRWLELVLSASDGGVALGTPHTATLWIVTD